MRSAARRSVSFTERGSNTTSSASEAFNISSALYRRRSPSPTRSAAFRLAEMDVERNVESSSSRTNPEVLTEESALKDELIRIFTREKDAMETHYLRKIQELLDGFKKKKLEWEELVKAEREDLESQFEAEKVEAQQAFASEIAKMTKTYQEEKVMIEKEYEHEIKLIKDEFEKEKLNLDSNWKSQMDSLRRQTEAEFEAKMAAEIKVLTLKSRDELEDRERRWKSDKEEMERRYRLEREELATKHNTLIKDAESRFEAVRAELERNFRDEKAAAELEWTTKLRNAEDQVRRETSSRIEVEQTLMREKAQNEAMSTMLKEEINRLKEELSRLRQQPPPPPPEVKITDTRDDSYNRISFHSRADLPGRLREEFDQLLREYKESLKDKFEREKAALEQKADLEVEKVKERMRREKEELERKLTEEKLKLERDLDRSRDDIEKELERRYRTKQLQESLSIQQAKFDEVAKKLEEQELLRKESLRSEEVRKYEAMMDEVHRENEGLKVKIRALEDNNNILRNLKDEGQQEVERLRRAVEELKMTIDAKRQCTGVEHVIQLSPRKEYHEDPFADERKRLQELRMELQRQDQELKERKMMEDVARKASASAHDKYEQVLREKRGLEMALSTLESKVTCMQEELSKLRLGQQTSPPQQTQPPISLQPIPSPTFFAHVSPMFAPPNNFSYPPPPQPQPPAPPLPPQHDSYPPRPPVMAGPLPREEDIRLISSLRESKDTLTRRVQELENDLRDVKEEKSALQRQLREYERQIAKLEEMLQTERETTVDVRHALSEEKMATKRLRADLDLEREKVIQTRRENEESYERQQREISELHTKLFYAGQTISAVRNENTEEEVRKLQYRSPSLNSLFSNANGGITESNRRSSVTKVEAHVNLMGSGDREGEMYRTSIAGDETERIRIIEREKEELERKLGDTKGAFERYTAKLGSQLRSLETKLQSADRSNSELSTKNVVLNATVENLEEEKRQQARQNWKLLQQKMQLQRLIERLTSINP